MRFSTIKFLSAKKQNNIKTQHLIINNYNKNIMKAQADLLHYQKPGTYEETRYEKNHSVIFENAIDASIAIAQEIATIIREKNRKGEKCVLGLATGSSPIKVYEELVRLHKEEGLSFKNVVTFNLDEYFPMKKEDNQSYHYFMHKHLFNYIDILPENIHIPNGELSVEEILNFCKTYEIKIKEYGGLDFQLLGIGRTGHIGFNEPGSHLNSSTRLITLDHLTLTDAAKNFMGLSNVPKRAITMGISTIMQAKRIIIMAWGHSKASIISQVIEGEITSERPATYLQNHSNTTFVLDKEASEELTRIKTPWLVNTCTWTPELIHKAVIWLSKTVKKPVLKLTDSDYNNNGLADLLANAGSSYDLNIKIFNKLQRSITGWPGGKPDTDDKDRPERANPARKRVIIFSPHPDDDVISMGGTFKRLIDQGHDVHVVYQTSGNIAVSDAEALKFLYIGNEFFKFKTTHSNEIFTEAISDLNKKTNNEPDSLPVRKLKGFIRRAECFGATRYYQLPDENVHFLDMPFYETGEIKKKPLGKEDIKIIKEIIERIQPHQIYAAGDLADPHGTHKVCLDAIFAAISQLKGNNFMKDCWVWLYRGAWHEWSIEEIEMAVPLSPQQVLEKRKAIFFHQSQKDGIMFQGDDLREFWQRSEDRNRDTAKQYLELGLANYEAIEAFKRYYF